MGREAPVGDCSMLSKQAQSAALHWCGAHLLKAHAGLALDVLPGLGGLGQEALDVAGGVDRLGHAAQRLGEHDEREAQHVEQGKPGVRGFRGREGAAWSGIRCGAEMQGRAGGRKPGAEHHKGSVDSHGEGGLGSDEHTAGGALVLELVRHTREGGEGRRQRSSVRQRHPVGHARWVRAKLARPRAAGRAQRRAQVTPRGNATPSLTGRRR